MPNQPKDNGPSCPQCDAALYTRHCKYVCPQHGVIYRRFEANATGLDRVDEADAN